MFYGCETRDLTKKWVNVLAGCDCRMLRYLAGITWRWDIQGGDGKMWIGGVEYNAENVEIKFVWADKKKIVIRHW